MIGGGAIPIVQTPRLVMRGFTDDDFETYAAWMGDDETARYIGGKALAREDAWRSLAMMVGHWMLRGYGMWAVVEKSTNALVGRVGLWNPEGWPGVEVGWLIGPAHRRKGYAAEAATASIEYGWRTMPSLTRLLSVIHIENDASIAVAKKIGERFIEHREVRGFSTGLWAIDRR